MTKRVLDTSRLTPAQRELPIELQEVALVQLIVFDNPDYPQKVVTPEHVPFIPLRAEIK